MAQAIANSRARNRARFPLELARHLARASWKPEFDFLYYHQNIARVYFGELQKGDPRGLLIYHETGMGKSILAASIAMDALFPPDDKEPAPPREVVILLAKSLAENMADAVKQYIRARANISHSSGLHALALLSDDMLDRWIARNFNFATMNASNMIAQIARTSDADEAEDLLVDAKARAIPRLDGKLLIVDEAHNLFRAITNGSANAAALYEAVMSARDVRIAFLTGTPIANNPFELAICFNMLAGSQVLPVHYADFARMFIGDDGVTMKNRAKFQNRIFGLVSYVNYKSKLGVGLADMLGEPDQRQVATEERPKESVEFPEELPTEVVRVPMSEEQYSAYLMARDKEKREGANAAEAQRVGARSKVFFARAAPARVRDVPALQKPKSEFSSTYRVHSRQIGNYCPPSHVRERDGASADLIDACGVIESAKFRAILARIERHAHQLGLIYSQFVGIGGIESLARFLDQNGYAGRYSIISGKIEASERARIVESFGARENAHGENIALLLVSSTGAEGIDLKNVRHVHILEPYWNMGRIKQVRARAIRNRAHEDLPPDERNVATYIYVAVASRNDDAGARERELTSDEELYENARRGQLLVSAFESALQEVSIECALNHNPADRAEHCRLCAPTDDMLFTDAIESDMRARDPCRLATVSRVSGTQKIKVGDTEFMYREASAQDASLAARVFGYEVFVFDSRIHAWRKMEPNDTRYDAIAAAIASSRESLVDGE